MSVAYRKPIRRALDRSCVVVVRVTPRSWDVFARDMQSDGNQLIATIRSVQGKQGKAYSYKLVTEQRVHKGFGSLKATVARILEKV